MTLNIVYVQKMNNNEEETDFILEDGIEMIESDKQDDPSTNALLSDLEEREQARLDTKSIFGDDTSDKISTSKQVLSDKFWSLSKEHIRAMQTIRSLEEQKFYKTTIHNVFSIMEARQPYYKLLGLKAEFNKAGLQNEWHRLAKIHNQECKMSRSPSPLTIPLDYD